MTPKLREKAIYGRKLAKMNKVPLPIVNNKDATLFSSGVSPGKAGSLPKCNQYINIRPQYLVYLSLSKGEKNSPKKYFLFYSIGVSSDLYYF